MKRFDRGPDFLGIGVQRAGTSWLFSCLREHPQVYMPRKEFHFFDNDYEKGTDWYAAQFESSNDQVLRGEFTPDYISSPEAMSRIHAYNPELKLLVILRNPLDRAYSAYRLFQSHGHLQGVPFDQALNKQPRLLTKSLYAEQLERVFQYFPRENVFVGLFEDIGQTPESFYDSVCHFLNVDNGHRPATLRSIRNASGLSGFQARYRLPQLQAALGKSWAKPLVRVLKRSSAVDAMKRRIARSASKHKSAFTVDKAVKDTLRAEIEKLEVLTGNDFSQWLDA